MLKNSHLQCTKRKVIQLPLKTFIRAYIEIYTTMLESYIYTIHTHTHTPGTTSRFTVTVLLLSCVTENLRRWQGKKWVHLEMEIASEVLNLRLRTCKKTTNTQSRVLTAKV